MGFAHGLPHIEQQRRHSAGRSCHHPMNICRTIWQNGKAEVDLLGRMATGDLERGTAQHIPFHDINNAEGVQFTLASSQGAVQPQMVILIALFPSQWKWNLSTQAACPDPASDAYQLRYDG